MKQESQLGVFRISADWHWVNRFAIRFCESCPDAAYLLHVRRSDVSQSITIPSVSILLDKYISAVQKKRKIGEQNVPLRRAAVLTLISRRQLEETGQNNEGLQLLESVCMGGGSLSLSRHKTQEEVCVYVCVCVCVRVCMCVSCLCAF